MISKNKTEKTLDALLSGSHPLAKRYGGKQVFVVDEEVILLGTGEKALANFKKLKKKHGKPPVLAFVPQPGSYILTSCQ